MGELDNGKSLSRLGLDDTVEAALNAQVNVEMSASMNYLAMSNYFARDSVALPGLAAHFRKESSEEREHAEQVMAYQTDEAVRSSSARWRRPHQSLVRETTRTPSTPRS